MRVYLVWRTARPWESDHMHLDSVCTTEDDASARVARIERAPERTRICAFVEPCNTDEPRDRSLLGDW